MKAWQIISRAETAFGDVHEHLWRYYRPSLTAKENPKIVSIFNPIKMED